MYNKEMKKVWKTIGRVVFWVTWPLLLIYLRIGKRTRVCIVSGDKVVVLKGWLGQGKWDLPGGGLHRGEKSVDGAIREVREETGLELSPSQFRFIGSGQIKKHGLKFDYDKFIVNLFEQLPLKPQHFEIVDLAWIPIGELDKNNASSVALKLLEDWQQQR